MDDIENTRVLGIAEYRAEFIAKSQLVKLTATGILPCANYDAQLEKRPERILPPMWDMIFYTSPICLKALKPFTKEVIIHNAAGAEHISVRDTLGEHLVPIQKALEDLEEKDITEVMSDEKYSVHARLPRADTGHHGCIVVPEGSILPAIYYRAFGPDTKENCDRFLLESCTLFQGNVVQTGGEIPWPQPN